MNYLKKRVVLPVLMALFGLVPLAATPGVTFLLNSGTKVSFAFSAKPSISVSSDGIIVSAQDHDDVCYLFSDVQRFFFEDDVDTAVKGVKTEKLVNPIFSYVNGVVTVCGISPNEQVAVYSLSGSKVNSEKADHSGRASVDMGHVPAGMYVVSTASGVSFKLLKK